MAAELDDRRRRARIDPSKGYSDRRELLLRAAAMVFHEVGLRAARMSDIAAQAGVDRASAYYYFRNSDELLFELLKRALADHEGACEEINGRDLDSAERLRELIVSMFVINDRHYPVTYIYASEDLTKLDVDDPMQQDLADSSQRIFECVRDTVRQGLEDGTIVSPLSPGVVAQTILGLIAWPGRWYRPQDDAHAREVGEGLASMVLDGLAATRRRRPRR